MNKSLLLILFIFISFNSNAQLLPPFQPEQNPCGALEICGNFYTPYSYQGIGTTSDLVNTPCGSPSNPCGEDNVVWFKLNIISSGVLVFRIIPTVSTDDYDWAILDGTGKVCSALNISDVIRCNFNTNAPVTLGGQTGLNMTSTLTSVAGGTIGNNFCRYLDVNAGDVYYLMVNNFGSFGAPTSGFFLNFDGSTATINVPPAPELESIVSDPCTHENSVRIKLNRSIKCSSIANDGSDFVLSPSGTIASAIGVDCGTGTLEGFTDEIILNFSSPLSAGTYTVNAAVGTDGNTLLNLCDIPLELPDNLNFNVYKLRDTVDLQLCASNLPYTWNDMIITGPGWGTPFVSNNIIGCDSITEVFVSVVDTIETIQNVTICTNQLPYYWNGFTINSAGAPAAQFNTFNSVGCDSISYLHLNVIPPPQVTQSLILCSYELPYVWNGITIPVGATSDANYDTFRTTTATGCDSFTILDLTVHNITQIVSNIDTNACGFLDYKGNTYTTNTLIKDTLFATTGCDSVYINLYIIIHSVIPYYESVDYLACDSITFRDQKYYNDTVIVDSIKNIYGCDSLVIFNKLSVQHFDLQLSSSMSTIVDGEILTLTTSADGVPYSMLSWTPEHYFTNMMLTEQFFFPKETNIYTAIAESSNGCIDTARIEVEVVPLVPEVIMPNAFSPNGDGLNDVFIPIFHHNTGYIINYFSIYNRWGQLVYTLQNSYAKGWDGTYGDKSEYAEEGVYYYFIEVQFINGQKVTLKGDVTLLR